MARDGSQSEATQLPVSHAFVVQLSQDSGSKCLRGRVQHLSTLSTAHFDSLEQLAGIMLRILGESYTEEVS